MLRSGRSTFTLACSADRRITRSCGAASCRTSFRCRPAELRSLIDRTRFAISTEETRYYLNGIYLHATKSNEVPVLRAVATDGHRLARMEMAVAARAPPACRA